MYNFLSTPQPLISNYSEINMCSHCRLEVKLGSVSKNLKYKFANICPICCLREY